jgi:Tfp pilus assembly major pilin PilA
MIVVAIIGILAAVAIPMYADYSQRAKVAGGVNSIVSYKSGVAMCFQELGTVTGCNHGTNGIPGQIGSGDSGATINYVDAVTVANGIISVTTTGVAGDGSTLLVITLDPTASAEARGAALNWVLSGNGCSEPGRSIQCSSS